MRARVLHYTLRMALLNSILVPTDFSASGDRALRYAVELATVFHAHVTVMHAYEIPLLGLPDGVVVATPELATHLSVAAEMGLKKSIEPFAQGPVALRTLLRQGPTWRAILDVATEISADMIVMGTHGRHGLPRALLGSVAEKIVRSATCPVLTVHAENPQNA